MAACHGFSLGVSAQTRNAYDCIKKAKQIVCVKQAVCLQPRAHSHIGCEDAVDKVLLGQVEGALQLVVVEGDLPGARAVEPRLHESGPSVLQEKSPADVVLADPRHAGIHRLAAVVLHCILPQEEEGEEADVIGRDKVGLYGGEEGERGSLHLLLQHRHICSIYLLDAVFFDPFAPYYRMQAQV